MERVGGSLSYGKSETAILFLKGQHQCNSIDFWTFFLFEGKVVRKNALRMYLAMYLR